MDDRTRNAINSMNNMKSDFVTKMSKNFGREKDSLNNVKNQQDLVQQYASQLAANETKMVALRDSQNELRRKKTALESELAAMMEKLDF